MTSEQLLSRCQKLRETPSNLYHDFPILSDLPFPQDSVLICRTSHFHVVCHPRRMGRKRIQAKTTVCSWEIWNWPWAVLRACHLSAWKAEAGQSLLVWDQPGLHYKFQASLSHRVKLVSKQSKPKKKIKQVSWEQDRATDFLQETQTSMYKSLPRSFWNWHTHF